MIKFLLLLFCITEIYASNCITTTSPMELLSSISPTGKFFLSYPRKTSWTQAVISCKEFQGYELVSIETSEKQAEIEEFLREQILNGTYSYDNWTDQIWTSGIKTDIFRWKSTGNSVTFSKWQSGEPSGFDYFLKEVENCIALSYTNSTLLEWNDTICFFDFPFICEKINNIKI